MDMNMERERGTERDAYYSEPPSKRFQQTKNTFLIYDIPDTKSVQELKAICRNDCFIPTSKGNHIKIMYYYSNSNDESIISNLRDLTDNHISIFNEGLETPRITTICEIQLLFNNLTPLVNKKFQIETGPDCPENQQSSNFNRFHDIDQEIQGNLSSIKERCIDILLKNHSKFIDAFRCLEKEREPEESKDISTDNCTWLALYCITWFFSYKLSSHNCLRYKTLFDIFENQGFEKFFEKFQDSDKILRYLIVDMFWQIIILTDQFNEEDEVIIKLPHILNGAAEPLARVYPEVYEFLPMILKTKRVSKHINGGIINNKTIQDFASKVYLVTLPSFLQGLTLFNGYIAIKKRSDYNTPVITEPVYKGFTLLTILHEYGNFMHR